MNTPLKTRHREDLPVDQGPSLSRLQGSAVGVLRLVVGWTFLWAFFDKLLALGYSTGRNPETDVVDYFGPEAWINGGSPTYGFLAFGADGPFKDFYTSIAGDTWTNWAFMLGLLAIGVAYMTGICTRLGEHRWRHHVRDDVDGGTASAEQPDHRRPHPRRGRLPGARRTVRRPVPGRRTLVGEAAHRGPLPHPQVVPVPRRAGRSSTGPPGRVTWWNPGDEVVGCTGQQRGAVFEAHHGAREFGAAWRCGPARVGSMLAWFVVVEPVASVVPLSL